ncbi:MAG: hypothetical protein Kow0063_26390 [Anaerolineae bacterium]
MSVGTLIAALLTFMVWSYLLGDNPAFRIAEHLFVGTAIGYSVLMAWFNVVQPALFGAAAPGSPELAVVPLFLCLLLMARARPAWAVVGNIPVALLVGVGAALAVGGALFGTLWPQVSATASLSLDPADYGDPQPVLASTFFWQNLAILVGTIGTFFYFTFNIQPQGVLGGFRETFTRFWSGIGRWVIMITLGALFANTVMSRIALLIGRVQWLLDVFWPAG